MMTEFYQKFKASFLLILLLATTGVKAQVSSYSFSTATSTYSEITGGTVIATATGTSGAASLDDVVYNLAAGTIPFNFNFDGTNYTGCYVSTNGFITFGSTPPSATGSTTGQTPISATTAYSGAASAFGRNLNAFFFSGNPAQTGQLRYETIGSAPNRTFVVQFKNFKTFNTSATTYGPVINMQIRLSEGSNMIEFAYNCSGNIASATGQVGLRGPNAIFPTNVNNRAVANGVNNWTTSTAGTSATSSVEISATLLPPSGYRYRFTPVSCPAAQNLFATNITQTTAQLKWTSSVTGSTFKVEYGPAGFTPGTGTVVNNAVSPLSISGLTQNTAYTFYVLQQCGASGNSPNVSANFTTGTVGEDCATATLVTVASSQATCNYTTITSGVSANGPNALCSDAIGGVPNDDRWVKFVAPSSGNKLVLSTTAGTVNDWVMEVWSACGGTAIKCADDDIGYMPQITLCQNEYVAGQTYYVRMWTYSNTATGTMNLCIYQDGQCNVPPVNDECPGAIRVPVNQPLSCPGSAQTFTTTFATVNVTAASCDTTPKRDVYFVFNTGNYTGLNIRIVPLTATNLKAQLIFECGGFQINCWNPANGTYNFTGFNPVADYVLRVWSDSAGAGTFSLCISATCSNPTAVISGNGQTICAGSSTPITVNSTGVPPYSFVYTDGTTNTTVNTSNAAYTFNVSPSTTKTYSLVSMSDASCAGGVSGFATVNVVTPQNATLAAFTPICSNASPIILTGGAPAGGLYSGTNVSNGSFNPSGGTQTITYTVTYAPGCTRSASQSYTVKAAPSAALASLGTVCNTSPAYALTGGSPVGGVYSGPGVSNNQFDPGDAGAGSHVIFYTYTAANGCSATASNSVLVLDCIGCQNAATASAGADVQSCGGTQVSISGSIGGSATSLTWSNYSGTISPNNTSATIMYTPSAAEITAGFAKLIITTNDPDGTGPCVAAKDTVQVNIIPVQTVNLAAFTPVCISAGIQTLSGGTPAGGVYTGTNVTNGTFNPSGGSQTITYTVTFAAGCTRSASQVFTVNPLPAVTMGVVGTYCNTDPAFTLTQGSPAGGTYSGPGVSNNIFTPANAGIGTKTIFYSYTNANGCTNTSSNNVVVNSCTTSCANPPTANAGANVQSCGGAAVSISGAIGGAATSLTWSNYSGTISPNNTSATITYTPSAAEITAGFASLILTTNDPDGTGPCVAAKDTVQVNITAVQNVTLSAFTPVCISAGLQTLTGGSPAGGVYSGTNVSAGKFNPSGGTQTITYTVTFAAGCTRSASQVFTVNPLPTVTMSPVGNYCTTDPAFTLTQGSPAGGTYSGPGVANNIFNPANAGGAGTKTIVYTYTNANGCTNTASNNVVVSVCTTSCANPAVANAGADKVMCSTATNIAITGTISGSASSATWSGGAGTYSPNATTLAMTYTPTAAEKTAGFVKLILTTNDPDGTGPCLAARDTMQININAVPNITAINGNTIICRPATGQVFSVTAQTGVTFTWTVPANYTITSGQGTNSITVNIASNAASGTISVTGTNTCGTSSKSLAITLRTSVPGTVGSISGTNTVCRLDSFQYKVAKLASADSYIWYPPVGATINGSSAAFATTDTAVWVFFTNTFNGDTLKIKGVNCKGISANFRTYTITRRTTAPGTPGTISGPADNLCGVTTATYSHAAVTGAKSYTWRSTIVGTLFNGQPFPYTTTNPSVIVTYPASWGATTGNLYVKSNNACASSTERTLAIRTVPAQPGAMTGPTSVCTGATSVAYSVPSVNGATSYLWTIPSGITLVSGQGTTSVIVNFNNTAATRTLRVSAVNACGTGTQRTMNVTSAVCTTSARITSAEQLSMEVFPNPVKDILNIRLESPVRGNCLLRLYDMEGSLVRMIPVPVIEGMNSISMEVTGLRSGLYLLQAEGNDSSRQLRIMIE